MNNALHKYGIEVRSRSAALRMRMPAELYNADWLTAQYAVKSGAQIAKELGVSTPVVHK